MSLEKFPREFPGILLSSAFCFFSMLISSLDKCSYNAIMQDTMLRFITILNFVEKKLSATTVPIKSDLSSIHNYTCTSRVHGL